MLVVSEHPYICETAMLQTIQHAISVRVRTGERVLLEGNPTRANVRAITKAGTVKKVCLLCSN